MCIRDSVAGAHPSAGAAVHSSAAPASPASPQRSSIGGAAAAAAFGARAPACAGRALRRCSNLRSSADSVGDAVATPTRGGVRPDPTYAAAGKLLALANVRVRQHTPRATVDVTYE